MQMRSTIGESQNFTFAPKETLSCSGSPEDGKSRVNRVPIKQAQLIEPEGMDLEASRGPGYMSDSEAKRSPIGSNNDRLQGSNSKVLPRKDMKRRDSMPDLRSNTRSFLYADPSSMLLARTGADLASQS